MIKLEQPIIVEGKYDKIVLENIVDTLIIPTDGFKIFKDSQKCELIRKLAIKTGIIIMTDSDGAGAIIRSYLKNITGNANIINVYVPRISGKEKRKKVKGKEGILGVEGMSQDVIKDALNRYGVTSSVTEKKHEISNIDLYKSGLVGLDGSKERRLDFLKYLSLPENLTTHALIDVLNSMYSLEEFKEKIECWNNKFEKSEISYD